MYICQYHSIIADFSKIAVTCSRRIYTTVATVTRAMAYAGPPKQTAQRSTL